MADREKLIELLEDVQRCGEDYTDYEIYGMRIPDTVSNEKVANHLISHGVTVRERGRWEEYQVPHIMCCSECDWATGEQSDFNFCPNCGADMREPPKGE